MSQLTSQLWIPTRYWPARPRHGSQVELKTVIRWTEDRRGETLQVNRTAEGGCGLADAEGRQAEAVRNVKGRPFRDGLSIVWPDGATLSEHAPGWRPRSPGSPYAA